jgi:hypothetical protein
MTKKEKVSYMLGEIEKIMHRLIDEKADEPFKVFEFLAITMDTFIKESQRPFMRIKIKDV